MADADPLKQAKLRKYATLFVIFTIFLIATTFAFDAYHGIVHQYARIHTRTGVLELYGQEAVLNGWAKALMAAAPLGILTRRKKLAIMWGAICLIPGLSLLFYGLFNGL